MQKLDLKQSLSQRLSPQQIQFMKLLQIPTMELSSRIQQELEENPTLENKESMSQEENSEEESDTSDEELSIEDYLHDDGISGYKMQGDGHFNEDRPEIPIPDIESFLDSLLQQLGYLRLSEVEYAIGKQIIGSIETDGYMRRPLTAIVNDLAFSKEIHTTVQEVEKILKEIQKFDPPGIAARTLQECLLIQLTLASSIEVPHYSYCIYIIKHYFDYFTKKHYDKILDKMHISTENLRKCIDIIAHLNPKPGIGSLTTHKPDYITPDFILKEVDQQLVVSLNRYNEPNLYVSPAYVEMFENYKEGNKKKEQAKKVVSFIKQKLDSAKWFIDALKQRQDTMLRTMRAIVEYQRKFFTTLDERDLKPMIIKNISDMIQMDISTVSRVISSKFVQTDVGIYPLKFFFSESISTTDGKQVSNKAVKLMLKKIIQEEPKNKPYSDEKIEEIFKQRGYILARRTIAKYRKQMNILPAILRKEI